MRRELKQKILDVIYAGDWSFRDKDYNKVEPNFFQFGLDNEDIIVEAIIAEVLAVCNKGRKEVDA